MNTEPDSEKDIARRLVASLQQDERWVVKYVDGSYFSGGVLGFAISQVEPP